MCAQVREGQAEGARVGLGCDRRWDAGNLQALIDTSGKNRQDGFGGPTRPEPDHHPILDRPGSQTGCGQAFSVRAVR